MTFERLEDLGQRRPAEERHAEDLEVAVAEHMLGIERDDVHVLEPRQREVLLTAPGRDLHHHRPIAERGLCGQEDAAGRAPAQLGEQPEAGEQLPNVGEYDAGRSGLDQALAIQEHRQLVAPSGKPPRDLGHVHLETGLLAQADLLVDQPDRRVIAELGVACQYVLGAGTLAPAPRGHHLVDLLRRV